MINDLFINVLLLISVTFVTGHILKDIPKNIISSVYGKVLLGIIGGILGVLSMIYTIQVEGTKTLLDLRVFAIMMVSYLGGIIPTIVTGIIISLYRSLNFAISLSSIIAIIQVFLYIVTFHIIDKKTDDQRKRWFLKTLVSLIILLSFFFYLLRNVENFHIILFQFSLVIVFASILEYFLLEYVRSSNELYIRYKKDSTKDFLTGLYNLRQFDKIFKLSFQRALENNEKLSCLMIDIDYFKKVNDTYGHPVGDLVLKELAYILDINCKESDFIGRIGGEEFCILLFNYNKDETFSIASRIKNSVQNHNFPISKNDFINITVSIGVSVYPDTISNLEDIKEQADIALYNAKRNGRNKVCFNN